MEDSGGTNQIVSTSETFSTRRRREHGDKRGEANLQKVFSSPRRLSALRVSASKSQSRSDDLLHVLSDAVGGGGFGLFLGQDLLRLHVPVNPFLGSGNIRVELLLIV